MVEATLTLWGKDRKSRAPMDERSGDCFAPELLQLPFTSLSHSLPSSYPLAYWGPACFFISRDQFSSGRLLSLTSSILLFFLSYSRAACRTLRAGHSSLAISIPIPYPIPYISYPLTCPFIHPFFHLVSPVETLDSPLRLTCWTSVCRIILTDLRSCWLLWRARPLLLLLSGFAVPDWSCLLVCRK